MHIRPAPRRFISRMDYARATGWMVRLSDPAHKSRIAVSKLFSDSKHGGKRKAFLAAQRWRDQQLKARGLTVETAVGPRRMTRCARNRSGVLGVHLIDKLTHNGSPVLAWVACWWDKKMHRAIFYFTNSSERRAFLSACEARRNAVGRLYLTDQYDPDRLPCAVPASWCKEVPIRQT